MADPIQATELRARDFGGFDAYPKIFETPTGLSAVRFFRVNGVYNEKDVLLAMGLPNLWEAHPDLPATNGLNVPVVQRREVVKVGGACFLVTVTYEPVTPGQSNPDDTAEDNTAFTEPRESTDQATIRADAINGDPIPETSIEASKLDLVVTCYKTSVNGALAAWAAIANKVNTNAVVFPAFRGSTEQITAAADQLLARSMAIEPVGRGLQKVTITFGYGPTNCWKLRWTEEDDEGQPFASHQNDLYLRTAFNTGAFWL